MAPIWTILGRNQSQRRDLDFEKKSGVVVDVVVVVVVDVVVVAVVVVARIY